MTTLASVSSEPFQGAGLFPAPAEAKETHLFTPPPIGEAGSGPGQLALASAALLAVTAGSASALTARPYESQITEANGAALRQSRRPRRRQPRSRMTDSTFSTALQRKDYHQ